MISIPQAVESYARFLSQITGWPTVITMEYPGYLVSAAGRGPEGGLARLTKRFDLWGAAI